MKSSTTWTLQQRLRDILVCPICKGDLRDVERGLLCDTDQIVFPVVENVPMMLVELAEPIDTST